MESAERRSISPRCHTQHSPNHRYLMRPGCHGGMPRGAHALHLSHLRNPPTLRSEVESSPIDAHLHDDHCVDKSSCPQSMLPAPPHMHPRPGYVNCLSLPFAPVFSDTAYALVLYLSAPVDASATHCTPARNSKHLQPWVVP